MQIYNKTIRAILIFFLSFLVLSCSTSSTIQYIQIIEDPILEQNEIFLQFDSESEESYRVLITSDRYLVSQMKYKDSLIREEDVEGDQYVYKKLKQYDKIDEMREGTISVWLYPDTGKLMKIRPSLTICF